MATPRFLLPYPIVLRFLFLIIMVVGCGSIFMLLGTISAYLIFDVNLMDASAAGISDDMAPTELNAKKLMLALGSIGMFVMPPIVFAHFLTKRKWAVLRVNRLPSALSVLLTAATIIVVLPIINWLAAVNMALELPDFLSGLEQKMHDMEASATEAQHLFLKTETISGLLLNIVMVALIPAVGEELLFRGVIQSFTTRITRSHIGGIWLAAFFFSAFHGQFFTFLPRFFLGAMLGYMLYWSGSLWLPILGHFINNAMAVIVGFLIDHGKVPDSVDSLGEGDGQWSWLAFSVLLLLGVAYLMWKDRVLFVDYPEEDRSELFTGRSEAEAVDQR